MSSDQPRVVESRPSALTSNPAHEAEDERDHGTAERPLLGDQVRDVVRLIQCRKCNRPLQEPVTLPCGRSLCKQCLPETHAREYISYPATPNRLQGFECPYQECGRNHAVGDCGVDVILTKAVNNFKTEMEKARETVTTAEISTHVIIQRPSNEHEDINVEDETTSRVVKGGPLVAVYTLADSGELGYDSNVSFAEVSSFGDEAAAIDNKTFLKVKESVRTEMDCQVCYALFYDPLTTVCGHTFCRSCLHRVLDHSSYCPICRRGLSVSPLLYRESCPSNEYLKTIIETFWADAVLTRGDALAAEALNRHREFDIPIFVCTLSFPMMPTFLHVFEPRYRLMIRRALEGDRTFGMVLPQRPRTANDTHFVEYGTLLRIVNAEYFADGRSLIETVGVSRFRITRHGILDGYLVGKIERLDDISIAEEEDLEANETQHALERFDSAATHQSEDSTTSGPPMTTSEDLAKMPTSELLSFGVSFVERMRQQSVPWLAQRMLTIYGECPNDPALFPWWFASILPAKEYEKYKLLETRSVRERLKICCGWILEWESSSW
ncbi:ATP-dependent protease La domain-containing protein [Colletotrichum graminicola M1.001]|uniref:ATP-dependent protease La domain-containing protein n=1 Tax=Colletotrichum graminicola (strain M1.001 / M2 / FGSC 10212) TaxID=645133 RepID=E3QR20_COLGM|nr:ATP-dependent protease La domain-containing protein [Colletotrichum graminicola M1.001]EFQ33308.1 ATP-dependent protease La domain-containing protein [Colletotrichum graminicola M1.001]